MKDNNNLDAITLFSLQITRAETDDEGIMRWQGVMSDIEPDRLDERTSVQLFDNWIGHVDKGEPAAEWLPKPRIPFLGIAHYQSFEGFGEAGETKWMTREGATFKAGGIFYDTKVGKALYNAVQQEISLINRGAVIDDPIRISSAWWDTCHSHGDYIFHRTSISDKCPLCSKGVGEKVYLDGQLDHFASTRVPINPRTNLELEEKSMAKITKKSDAASIVGDELAEALELKQIAMIGKSGADDAAIDSLIIKADKEANDEDDMEEDDMEEGDGTQKDVVVTTKKTRVVKKKAKPKKEVEQEEVDEETDEEMIEEKSFFGARPKEEMPNNEMVTKEFIDDDLYGVTSFKEAEEITQRKKDTEFLCEQKRIWNKVASGIIDAQFNDVPDKVVAVITATNDLLDNLTEYQGTLVAKSNAIDDDESYDVDDLFDNEQEDYVMEDLNVKSASDLETMMQVVYKSDAEREDKYLQAQEIIESFAMSVKAAIDETSEPTEVSELADTINGAFSDVNDKMDVVAKSLADTAAANQQVLEQIGLLVAKFSETMEQKSVAQSQPVEGTQETVTNAPIQRSSAVHTIAQNTATPPLNSNIPVPQIPNAALMQKALVGREGKGLTLREITRHSVGLKS